MSIKTSLKNDEKPTKHHLNLDKLCQEFFTINGQKQLDIINQNILKKAKEEITLNKLKMQKKVDVQISTIPMLSKNEKLHIAERLEKLKSPAKRKTAGKTLNRLLRKYREKNVSFTVPEFLIANPDINRNTLKSRLAELVGLGEMIILKKGRGQGSANVYGWPQQKKE